MDDRSRSRSRRAPGCSSLLKDSKGRWQGFVSMGRRPDGRRDRAGHPARLPLAETGRGYGDHHLVARGCRCDWPPLLWQAGDDRRDAEPGLARLALRRHQGGAWVLPDEVISGVAHLIRADPRDHTTAAANAMITESAAHLRIDTPARSI